MANRKRLKRKRTGRVKRRNLGKTSTNAKLSKKNFFVKLLVRHNELNSKIEKHPFLSILKVIFIITSSLLFIYGVYSVFTGGLQPDLEELEDDVFENQIQSVSRDAELNDQIKTLLSADSLRFTDQQINRLSDAILKKSDFIEKLKEQLIDSLKPNLYTAIFFDYEFDDGLNNLQGTYLEAPNSGIFFDNELYFKMVGFQTMTAGFKRSPRIIKYHVDRRALGSFENLSTPQIVNLFKERKVLNAGYLEIVSASGEEKNSLNQTIPFLVLKTQRFDNEFFIKLLFNIRGDIFERHFKYVTGNIKNQKRGIKFQGIAMQTKDSISKLGTNHDGLLLYKLPDVFYSNSIRFLD